MHARIYLNPMKSILVKVIFTLFIIVILNGFYPSIVSANGTCSDPTPDPVISNCNFQPKISPLVVAGGDEVTITFQQGWCGGTGASVYFNVPGKFISFSEDAYLATVNLSSTPAVFFPHVPDAGTTMTYVQRKVVFQVSKDLKEWKEYTTCPRALGYYEPPGSDTGPYVTIKEAGHNYLPFTVTLPQGPLVPDDPTPTPEPSDPDAVAKVAEINIHGMLGSGKPRAEFYRDGEWSPLKKNTDLHLNDKIRTDKDTTVAIEFAIGGRVGIRQNSEVTISGERSAKDSNVKKVTLEKGGIWAKCDKLKEPFEVQTNGGVMGIKG